MSSNRVCSHSAGAFAWCAAPPKLVPHFDKYLDVSWSAEWLLAKRGDALNVLEVASHISSPLVHLSLWKNTMGLWSFLSVMAFVLLYSSHPKFVAQAEVSSPKARLYRLEVTLLEARAIRKSTEVKFDNSAKVVIASESEAAVALNPNNGEEERKETQSGLENGALIGNNVAPNCHKRLKIPGKKCDNISEDDQGDSAANLLLENTFPEIKKRAKRSVRSAFTNNVDRSTSGEAQSKERFVETVQGVSNSRPEYRRTAEETKGSNPRQSEPHLDTSTFALSGDSAHNQAMVHWSGHNSSVSFSFYQNVS